MNLLTYPVVSGLRSSSVGCCNPPSRPLACRSTDRLRRKHNRSRWQESLYRTEYAVSPDLRYCGRRIRQKVAVRVPVKVTENAFSGTGRGDLDIHVVLSNPRYLVIPRHKEEGLVLDDRTADTESVFLLIPPVRLNILEVLIPLVGVQRSVPGYSRRRFHEFHYFRSGLSAGPGRHPAPSRHRREIPPV